MRVTPVGIVVLSLLAFCVGLIVAGPGASQVVGIVGFALIVIVVVAEGVTVSPFIDGSDHERKAELAMRDAETRSRAPLISAPAKPDEDLWARERERRRRLADEREQRGG